MDSLVKLSDLEYDKEVEKEAIRLAAFSIIKAMFSEGMISESELHCISESTKFQLNKSSFCSIKMPYGYIVWHFFGNARCCL